MPGYNATNIHSMTTSALAQDVIHGRVVGVTDGDTIKVLTAEKQLIRVRVAWIDAPRELPSLWSTHQASDVSPGVR